MNTPSEVCIEQDDNWLEIVETIKPIIETSSSYITFYDTVLTCFRLLGWKKSIGTIITSPSKNSNVKEELFVLNIVKDNLHIPVVPVDFKESINEDLQIEVLFKAMEEWNSNIGILFTKSIQVFYKSKNENEIPICIFTIQFDEKDIYGNALCNLLSFHSFNYKQIESFCENEYEKISSRSNVIRRIRVLSKENYLIQKMVKDYLVSEGFEEKIVDRVLKKYSLSINIRDLSNIKFAPITQVYQRGSRNTTRFSIDGGKTFYNKRHFVLNVIRQYIKENPKITLNELEKRFPSEIISKTRGVIRPLTVVQKWIKEKPDVATRYFMASSEIITLYDGMQIVVHNQWGNSFYNFLAIARLLYDVKSDQPHEDIHNKSNEEGEPEEKFGIKISVDSFSKFRSKK